MCKCFPLQLEIGSHNLVFTWDTGKFDVKKLGKAIENTPNRHKMV
jgi:hypothetical protein